MSSKKTIAITGAGGFVGTELVTYFSDKGWQVIGLVRDPAKYQEQSTKNVRYEAYDLAKPVAAALFKGVDYVVHTAYVKFDRSHPDALDVNVGGARQLHAAAHKAGVKRLVFLSTMSAHEEAVSVYGQQKLAIEKIFSKPNDTILRCGLIIGKGGIVQQMVGFLKTKRLVPLVDGGKQPLQVISVHDLTRIIERVYENNIAGLLTIANPQIYAYKELYETIGKLLGVKLIFVPVPFIVLLSIMRIISFLRLPLPVSEDNLWGLKMLRSSDNAKDIKKLGLSVDDLESALRRTGIITS